MRFYVIVFRAYIFIIGSFVVSPVHSQNQALADSLIDVFKTRDLHDTVKLIVLRKIAHNETHPTISLKYAKKLLDLSTKLNSKIDLYRGYLQLGYAYRKLGELEFAIEAFLNSLKTAKENGMADRIGTAFITLGDVYSSSGHHKNAIEYYHLAIKSLLNFNKPIALASAYSNIGYEYYLNDKLDSALFYFLKSKIYFEKGQYELGIVYNTANIGLVYAKSGNQQAAQLTIDSAITSLEKFGDRYAIADIQNEMASIYIKTNQYKKALQFLENSYQTSLSLRLKEQIRDASLKLSELYGLMEDHKNAYIYQSQYIAYRDSINSEGTIQNMADLRTEYEVSQKQIEVDLLEQEKRTQQIVGYAMAAVLLLIIVLAIVLYRTGKQRQLTNTLLARQKATVESQRDQLEGLNNTKDRFFSIISHDLRGPVNAFAGVAELIRYYVKDKAYDELVEVTDHIDQSSSQLSALLDNLLNWAVCQQGEFPYSPEQVNISEMTTELKGVFQNMSSAKNIELVFDVASKVTAYVDRNSTMTILRNLVGNALKFTESEGTITLTSHTEGDQTIVKVKDTGVGIPADKLSTLFQLQEKKSTWGTDGEKGLGLGLQLAFEFAEMNKGSIVVSSEEGVGTTFTVTLPSIKS